MHIIIVYYNVTIAFSGRAVLSLLKQQCLGKAGGGLVFNQFCTDKSRLSKGPYLAHIFKQLLAKLGEKQLDGLNSFVEQADGHSSPFELKTVQGLDC